MSGWDFELESKDANKSIVLINGEDQTKIREKPVEVDLIDPREKEREREIENRCRIWLRKAKKY